MSECTTITASSTCVSCAFLLGENMLLRKRIEELTGRLEMKYERHRAIDGGLRMRVWRRDAGRCQYCGKQGPYEEVEGADRLPSTVRGVNWKEAGFTLDHVMPLSRGGKTEYDNLVVACKPCNSRKWAKTLEEAGMSLRGTRNHSAIVDACDEILAGLEMEDGRVA